MGRKMNWQAPDHEPERAGLYERDWSDGQSELNTNLDYWNGECWKYTYDGEAMPFTALPNKRWREPQRENIQ